MEWPVVIDVLLKVFVRKAILHLFSFEQGSHVVLLEMDPFKCHTGKTDQMNEKRNPICTWCFGHSGKKSRKEYMYYCSHTTVLTSIRVVGMPCSFCGSTYESKQFSVNLDASSLLPKLSSYEGEYQ